MTISIRLPLAVTAAIFALAIFGTSRGATEAAIQVSSDNVLIGGEPVVVSGTGLASCAGSTVSASLIFPTADDSGNRQPVSEATRINTVVASVDGSGSFEAAVAAPGSFPGAWLGYVVVEDDCIDVTVKRLLANVHVSVLLGSDAAQQFGISQEEGAVLVVPADDIRDYPIMVDDPVKDPYVKLAPFVAVASDGSECGRAEADDRNSNGDVLIPLSAECSVEGTVVGLKVLSSGLLLNTQITVHEGQASGVRMVFPPPQAASETPVPAPPSAGNAAAQITADSPADATLWLVAFALGCAATVATMALRRR
jgi:hypothetical protein